MFSTIICLPSPTICDALHKHAVLVLLHFLIRKDGRRNVLYHDCTTEVPATKRHVEGTVLKYETAQEAVTIAANLWPMMSAINVTAKTFFERLYLVLGLQKIAPRVNCPYAPTTPTVHSTTVSRFLCYFFPRMAPHFFVITIHQVLWPSPGTLVGLPVHESFLRSCGNPDSSV